MGASLRDGDVSFAAGMRSGEAPEQLSPGAYVRSMNTLNRGGRVRCRPGFTYRMTLPDGNLQGVKLFTSSDGTVQIVFAVNGRAYYSVAPFSEYRQVPDLEFSPYAPQLFWAQCEKVVQRNDDDSLTLITPKTLLLMQDGYAPPAYWDGQAAEHIIGGTEDAVTPQGTVMCWAGSRLWVARDSQVFASDIGDPLSFFEGQYVNTTGAFVLPGRVSAMAEIPDVVNPQLAVFTPETTTILMSNLRQRSLWGDTPNFQLTVFPTIGCPAARGVHAHNGLLWWFSQFGLTNLDIAQTTNRSGRLVLADDAMAWSKARLGGLESIAMTGFENYLLSSVPFADLYNRHTWVLDAKGEGSWCSYWTGIRPVEWATGLVDGKSRIFCVSKDHDGKNRLWEAFSPQSSDNGTPITWTWESRGYDGGTTAPKQFRWAEFMLSELSGVVDVAGYWAGASRGRYKKLLDKHIVATPGSISSQVPMRFDRDDFALKPQSREIVTQEQRMVGEDSLTSEGVESDQAEWVDRFFQVALVVSGAGALNKVRLFADAETDSIAAKCEEAENEPRGVRFDGAAATGADVRELLQSQSPVFSSTKTYTATVKGTTISRTSTVRSSISQAAADEAAQKSAEMKVAAAAAELPPTVGSQIEP